MNFDVKISAANFWRMYRCGELSEQPETVRAFAEAFATMHDRCSKLLERQPGSPVHVEPGGNLAEIIERARVVGVLDAWADLAAHRSHELVRLAFGAFEVRFHPNYANGHALCVGATPDAARAAAAKAIEAGEV